jgi:hypothetical protein
MVKVAAAQKGKAADKGKAAGKAGEKKKGAQTGVFSVCARHDRVSSSSRFASRLTGSLQFSSNALAFVVQWLLNWLLLTTCACRCDSLGWFCFSICLSTRRRVQCVSN